MKRPGVPDGALNIPNLLSVRASGLAPPCLARSRLTSWALENLSQCHTRAVERTSHSASITAMDLDREEARYLLLGAGDGTLYIHDIQMPSSRSRPQARTNLTKPTQHSLQRNGAAPALYSMLRRERALS